MDIVKFDPQAWANQVRERVRSVLMETVPNEQIEALVAAEVKAYFEPEKVTIGGHYYHNDVNSYRPSGFQRLVKDTLDEEVKIRLKNFLTSNPQWGIFHDCNEGGNIKVGEKMVEAFKNQAGIILDGLITRLAGEALMHMRNRM